MGGGVRGLLGLGRFVGGGHVEGVGSLGLSGGGLGLTCLWNVCV